MTRILYVINGLLKGGAERQIYYLITNLPKNYKVKVCTFIDGYFGEQLRKKGVEVIILRKDFSAIKQFLNIVKEFQPDIVHSWLPHSNIFCKFCGLFSGYRLICSMRGKEASLKYYFAAFIERLLDFRSNLLVTNSNSFRKYLNKKELYKKSKIKVINNAYIQKKISKLRIKKELNLKNRKVISVVANFRPGKDYPGAVKVAKELLKLRKDFVFLFVGDGELRPKIERLVKNEKLENHIKFLGVRNDVINILSDSDIFFLPTLMEAQSNSIIEAMFTKCPIVTTKIPGNEELIENGKTGILVEVKDYKKMAASIDQLLNKPILRRKLAKKAYEKAIKMFSLKDMVESYVNLYEFVLKENFRKK